MAAPNIAALTTVTGKTNQVALSTTSATTVISNPASSDKVFKVNMLRATNVDAVAAVDVTVEVHSAASGGGTGYALENTKSIAVNTSADILDKSSMLYLEEDRSITVTASAADGIVVVVSYEEIS
jgi:hypothetical protein